LSLVLKAFYFQISRIPFVVIIQVVELRMGPYNAKDLGTLATHSKAKITVLLMLVIRSDDQKPSNVLWNGLRAMFA